MTSMKYAAVLLFGSVAAAPIAAAQTDQKFMRQVPSSPVSTEQRMQKIQVRDSTPRVLPPSPCRDDRCKIINTNSRSGSGDSRALNPQPIPPGKPKALNPQPIPPGKPQALNPQPIPPGIAVNNPPKTTQKKKKKKIYME